MRQTLATRWLFGSLVVRLRFRILAVFSSRFATALVTTTRLSCMTLSSCTYVSPRARLVILTMLIGIGVGDRIHAADYETTLVSTGVVVQRLFVDPQGHVAAIFGTPERYEGQSREGEDGPITKLVVIDLKN